MELYFWSIWSIKTLFYGGHQGYRNTVSKLDIFVYISYCTVLYVSIAWIFHWFQWITWNQLSLTKVDNFLIPQSSSNFCPSNLPLPQIKPVTFDSQNLVILPVFLIPARQGVSERCLVSSVMCDRSEYWMEKRSSDNMTPFFSFFGKGEGEGWQVWEE